MHREAENIWRAFPRFPFTLGFAGVFAPFRWEYLTIPSVSHFLERFYLERFYSHYPSPLVPTE